MKTALKLLIPAAVLVLTACAKAEKDDVESDYPESNVETTETTPGVIQGSFKKDATDDQTMVGSQNSENKETYIQLPPGALAVDTTISMRDGNNDTPNALPSALEMADLAILGGTTPVLVGAVGITETAEDFALNIPLPLAQAAASRSLALADGASKVGILYYVKVAGATRVGLYMLGQDDLVGTIVRYKGAKFGWFRIVVLSKAGKTTEVATEDSSRIDIK